MTGTNLFSAFDLDGTLADTILDIANSVNLTRRDYGLEPLAAELVVSYVGDGARKLLERAFADNPINVDEGLEHMIRHYYEHPVVDTVLYPGVAEGLAALKNAGWKLAVVTNKPGIVAREILRRLGVAGFLDEIIGGNDGYPLKPDPAVLLFLMEKYHAVPEKSWMLGDNHTDMNSAVNAGMNGAFAAWGFGSMGNAAAALKVDSFARFTRNLLEEQA
ncbi:MAG: HAD hydrolase-like protein [Lentisphaeria bacterium]|nr:HAD hydrolase-like protein [Lentisphaeria bacterium]